MGCCVSKCRPENHSLEDQFHGVQDKLVIAQAPPTPIPYSSKRISPSPPSPTFSSTSSISSSTCITTFNSITSSSSSASSALSSKDRSFSNEFLWSCYKENPHIIRINSLKEATHSLSAQPSLAPPIKQSPQQKVAVSSSMPQKGVRSNSPANLTRQKSFKKEPKRLRSPSPSRRFNGNHKCGSALPPAVVIMDNSLSKRMIGSKNNAVHSSHCVSSSSIRKEIVKPVSPSKSSRRLQHSGLRHTRESCSNIVGYKIDGTKVEEMVSNKDMDSGLNLMEDIDNPLISLDCFIFL